MRIVTIRRLREFWKSGYADSEQPLKLWYRTFKKGQFQNPVEIKWLFPSCSFIGNNRVIFNIAGNKYRLVVHIKYNLQTIYIRFVGTHAEYDKINAGEV